MDAILRTSKRVRSPEQVKEEEEKLETIANRRELYSEDDDPEQGLSRVVMLDTCKPIQGLPVGAPASHRKLHQAVLEMHSLLLDCDAALVEKKLDEFHRNAIRAMDAWLHSISHWLTLPADLQPKNAMECAMRQFKEEHFYEAYVEAREVFMTKKRRESAAHQKRRILSRAKAAGAFDKVFVAHRCMMVNMAPPDCAQS